MRLFIFGAGSSRGTLGLPTVAGFGRALASKVPNWRSKFGALEQIVDALDACDKRDDDDWNLDAAWTHVDYVAKLEVAPFPPSGSHGLHAAVVTVYGAIAPLIAQAKAALDNPDNYTLRDILDRVREDDCCSAHIHVEPEPPSKRLGRPIASELDALVLECLAKDPAQRPRTAAELRDRFLASATVASWVEADAATWWKAKGHPWCKSREAQKPRIAATAATLGVDVEARLAGC